MKHLKSEACMYISEVIDLACVNNEPRELHTYGSELMKKATQNEY